MVVLRLFIVASLALAQPNLNPPVAAPEDFSGVAGLYFITSSADPTNLNVEDPLILKVQIRGQGLAAHQPKRTRLRIVGDDIKKDFFVEDVPEQDSFDKRSNTWEFVYRLRPKSLSAKEIPSLKLVYYSFQERFQTAFSDAIPLTVRARPEVKIEAEPIAAPLDVLRVNAAPAALRTELPYAPPSLWIMLVVLAVPPLVCGGVIWIWRRLHPDIVKSRSVSNSRTAQQTLRQLKKARNDTAAVDLFTQYLQQRLDMTVNEPTPAEVTAFLRQRGVPREVRHKCETFYAKYHRSRFAPIAAENANGCAVEAEQLIAALESCCRGGKHPCLPAYKLDACGFALCFLFTATALAAPATNEEVFSEAITCFNRGREKQDASQFVRAAELFEELSRRGVHNPDHYLNQGNASFLAGDLPHAILAYRRGLQLAPADGALQANLDYARARVVHERTATRPPDNALPPWLLWPPPGVVLSAAFALYSLALAGFTTWWITARFPWFAATLVSFALALFCAADYGVLQWHANMDAALPLVVVVNDKTPFYQGNGTSYPRQAEAPHLPRGAEARRLHQRGDWLQIQFASGLTGWIQKDAVVEDSSSLRGVAG